MKKSFIYAAPAALVLALFLAGCPTDAEEDSGGNGNGSATSWFETGVETIAIAYADGADTVYLKSDLPLGVNELVIPAGKTLDLSRDGGVTVNQIGADGKLVVVGDFVPGAGAENNIILYSAPTAKIIITEEKYQRYVDDAYRTETDGKVVPTGTPDATKFIKALPGQVIKFVTFTDIGNAANWVAYINAQAEQANSEYIPVLYNGVIDDGIAEVIGKYGSGRRVYIVGNVTIESHIDLTQTKWVPTEASPEQLYNLIPDDDGSLVIGGAVLFKGAKGEVSTKNGLTILGPITTDSKNERGNAKVNLTGELLTYLVDTENGGASFGGGVRLISSLLTSKLGGAIKFSEKITANGPVILNDVTFDKGAEFYNKVELIGKAESVAVGGGNKVVIGGEAVVNYNGPDDPVDVTDTNTFDLKDQITYTEPYDAKDVHKTFDNPVVFNKTTTFGSGAVFNKNVTFNDYVYFSTDVKHEYHFGTGAVTATFARPVSFDLTDGLYYRKGAKIAGGTLGTVVFNNTAEFYGYTDADRVYFLGPATFKDTLTLNAAGLFAANANFEKDVAIGADKEVAFEKTLSFGYSETSSSSKYDIRLLPVGNGVASIRPDPAGGGVTVKDGELSVPVGTLTVNGAIIDIRGKGKDNAKISIGIEKKYPTGIVFTGNGGTIAAANHSINAAVGGALYGKVTREQSPTSVTIGNTGFTGAGNVQATLLLAGANNIYVTKDITISGVTVDLGGEDDDNEITVRSNGDRPVITLTGGQATVLGGTVYSGAVGGIKTSADTGQVYGSTVGLGTLTVTSIPTGYLVSSTGNIDGQRNRWITGAVGEIDGGTITAEGGTVGILGTTQGKLADSIGGNNGFVIFYGNVTSADQAKAITVDNTGELFYEADGDGYEATNIAVFGPKP